MNTTIRSKFRSGKAQKRESVGYQLVTSGRNYSGEVIKKGRGKVLELFPCDQRDLRKNNERYLDEQG